MPYISKTRTFFSLSFFLLFCTCTHNTPTGTTVNHSPTFNNNPNITGSAPVFNTHISPHVDVHTTSVINAIGVKIGDIAILIKQTIITTFSKKNYDRAKQTIRNILWKNRYKIAGGAIVSSYSAVSLLLIADDYQLNNTLFWAHWKHDATFEDLCTIAQKELRRELMLTIGQHHYNKDNPTDLAYPLITFIKTIEQEINIIKRYITTAKILRKLYLMPLFPTNEKKLERATRMLERVLFIRHIFLSWLADHNLTSTEKLSA